MTGIAARCVGGHRQQPLRHVVDGRRDDPGEVDALGVVLSSPSAMPATVVTVPATPTSVCGRAEVHRLADHVERPVDVVDERPHLLRRSAGRRAGAARSAGRSRCRPNGRRERRGPSPSTNSVEPPPMSTTR